MLRRGIDAISHLRQDHCRRLEAACRIMYCLRLISDDPSKRHYRSFELVKGLWNLQHRLFECNRQFTTDRLNNRWWSGVLLTRSLQFIAKPSQAFSSATLCERS